MKLSAFRLAAALCVARVPTANCVDQGNDLHSFVSAPLLKPPIFNVSVNQREKVGKGYWFLAPYASLAQNRITSQFEECQIGPAIYDNNGSLIWSGACELRNSNVFDFKTWDGSNSHLSFVVNDRLNSSSGGNHATGGIMNQNFNQHRIHLEPSDRPFNMHEFTVIDGGNHAIMLTNEMGIVETPESLGFENNSAMAWKGTIIEFDLATKKSLFEWDIIDHIPMTETQVEIRQGEGGRYPWDWVHPNSVDKNEEGDYLLSARFTDCIYKISGKDGSIIWRLGGKNSSFELDGFNFSRQHDARFQGKDGDKILISLLNNAADEFSRSANTSAGYLIELDTKNHPMTAKLKQQWLRPDGRLSRLRGNMQMLSNGNVFIGWSQQGYITEFDAEGQLLLEAKFMSSRFMTYRAYKLNFVGRPSYPPAVKSKTFSASATHNLTTIYVSWNGATDIASWKFYASQEASKANFSLLGQINKLTFETVITAAGHWPFVYVEALMENGDVLGKSDIVSSDNVGSRNISNKLKTKPQQFESDSTPDDTHHEKSSHELSHKSIDQWFKTVDPAQKYFASLITGLLLGVIMTLFTTKMIGYFT